jgi:zinc protease
MNKGVVANYTIQMLNKGTKNYSRQDIQDKLSAIKSSVYFNGSNGKVAATINTTEEHLNEALALMTDMLKNPKFDAGELEKLKIQDLAAIEENRTDPNYLASKKLSLLIQRYPKGHPLYVRTIEEDIEAINEVSIEKIQAYYDTFFGISNSATLVAIGNIDEQALKDYFEKEFADFKSDKPYTPIPNKFVINKSANEKIRTPDKKNAISLGILNAEVSQSDEDYAALQIAGEILGGGFLNSRIASRLRQQDGVSYAAGGQLSVDAEKNDKNSSILVYAMYAPENTAKVQVGFKEEIDRFIKEGITEEELKVAVASWVQGENVSRAKDGELTNTINNNLYYDRDMMFQKRIEDKATSLTVEDVNKVIKKYFKPLDQWTVVNAGDFMEDADIKSSDKKVD